MLYGNAVLAFDKIAEIVIRQSTSQTQSLSGNELYDKRITEILQGLNKEDCYKLIAEATFGPDRISLVKWAMQSNMNGILEFIRNTFKDNENINAILKKATEEKFIVKEEAIEFEEIVEVPDIVSQFAIDNGFMKDNEAFDINQHYKNPHKQSILTQALEEKNYEVAQWLEKNWPKNILLYETEEELEQLFPFYAVMTYGQDVQKFLEKNEYKIQSDFNYNTNDVKLKRLLILALNSNDAIGMNAAKGLLEMGVSLPINKSGLTPQGHSLHNKINLEIATHQKEFIENQQEKILEFIVSDTKNALQKKDSSALLNIVNQLAPEGPAPIPLPPINSLAFQGGGPRGACYDGVNPLLDKMHIAENVRAVSGASTGAINAFGYALGLNGDELNKLAENLDYTDLIDTPTVGGITRGGAISGINAYNWFRMICQEVLGNADATFGDLCDAIEDPDNLYHQPGLKHLTVMATITYADDTEGSKKFSTKDPKVRDVKLADAVRASMSIPSVYEPWKIQDINGNYIGTYVDGGVLNNFPIEMLDDNAFTDTHLGIKYELVQQHTKDGAPILVNPCSFGFSFVDEYEELRPEVTELTPHLKEETEKRNTVFKQRTEKKLAQKEQRGFFNTLGTAQIGLGGLGVRKPEDLDAKYDQHPGRVVILLAEGIKLESFGATAAEKKQAADNGRESTEIAIQKLITPSQTYNRDVKVYDLEIEQYLFLLEQEMSKYQTMSSQYPLAKIKENTTLQFLTKKIQEQLEKRPNKSVTAEEYLAEKIEIFQKNKNKKIEDAQKARDRIQNITNDQDSLKAMAGYIQNGEKDKFNIMFKGLLSRGIELSTVPIHHWKGLNILQVAIQKGDYESLENILSCLQSSYAHKESYTRALLQQGLKGLITSTEKETTYFDIVNKKNGGLLNYLILSDVSSNKKLLCLKVMIKNGDVNPLEEDNKGFTPLHHAVLMGDAELFKELMSVVNVSFFDRSYSTINDEDSNNLKSRETLFEYILKQGNPKFLQSLYNDYPTFCKLFKSTQLCPNGFTMEEMLAKYSRDAEKPEVWTDYYPKYYTGGGWYDIEGNKNVQLKSVETKEIAQKQKEAEEQAKKEAHTTLKNKFTDLLTNFDSTHTTIDLEQLKALTPEEMKNMMNFCFQEQSPANGLNFLCYACSTGNIEAAKIIIAKLEEANVDIIPFLTDINRDKSPLVWAIEHHALSPSTDNLELIKLLLEKGVRRELINKAGSADCPCALTLAAKLECNDIVEILFPAVIEKSYTLAAGSRHISDNDGRQLLHHLAMNPNTTPELFLKIYTEGFTGAYDFPKHNVVDKYGKTPLHYLMETKHGQEIIKHMLQTPISKGYTGLLGSKYITLSDLDFEGSIGYSDKNIPGETKPRKDKPFYQNLNYLEYACATDPEFAEFLANKLENGPTKLTEAQKSLNQQAQAQPEVPIQQNRALPVVSAYQQMQAQQSALTDAAPDAVPDAAPDATAEAKTKKTGPNNP